MKPFHRRLRTSLLTLGLSVVLGAAFEPVAVAWSATSTAPEPAQQKGKPRGGKSAGKGKGKANAGPLGGITSPKSSKPKRQENDPRRGFLPEIPTQEHGAYPMVYDQTLDVRAELGFAHQDTTGGCEQTVLSVAGTPEGGFAAIIQDERKGNIGLFLARLDANGERLGEQLPISDQVGTARELFPAVAPSGGGAGALVWMKMSGRSQAHLRFFDLDREAWSDMLPLGSKQYQAKVQAEVSQGLPSREARGADAIQAREAPTMADVVHAEDGRTVVAWKEGDRILLGTYRDGKPERPPVAVNKEAAPGTDDGETAARGGRGNAAVGGPRVTVDPAGRILVAWDTEDGIARYMIWDRSLEVGAGRENRPSLGPAGKGSVQSVHADPRGGFWMLVEEEKRLVLRHLDVDAMRDRADVVVADPAPRSADVATWAYGLCLLVENARGRQSRELSLTFLNAGGKPSQADPITIAASPRAKGAFLASEGPRADRLLVAWNDDRERNSDVFTALLTRGPDGPVLGADSRWNDDVASSYQLQASIASNGERAVVSWGDERASAGHIYFRLLDADGQWAGDERLVDDPEPVRDRQMRRSATAMNSDGRFAVAWVESAAPREPFRLRAQVFDATGAPVVPAFDIDPGFDVDGNSAPACAALLSDRGFVIAWLREGVGPVARRVSWTGELLGEAWRASDRRIPQAANVELCRIAPDRLVCVWDEPSKKARVLTGRLLSGDAIMSGPELQFAWSGGGGDVDAELCATGDGGFLMAWTGRDGPPRDVLARFFGPDGQPTSLPLGISTIANEQDYCDVAMLADGSFVVVWEDDISGIDHAVARRIHPDRETLGEIVMIDPKTGKHVEVRHAPRVAALGDGFVSAWNDHGASRGVDIVARLIGGAFDDGIAPIEWPDPPLGPPKMLSRPTGEGAGAQGPAQGRGAGQAGKKKKKKPGGR